VKTKKGKKRKKEVKMREGKVKAERDKSEDTAQQRSLRGDTPLDSQESFSPIGRRG